MIWKFVDDMSQKSFGQLIKRWGTNNSFQNEAVLYLTLLTLIVLWESFWQNQSFYLKNIFQESVDHSDSEGESEKSDFLKSEVKDFEGNVKDEEDLEEDDDQKDYSESESDSDTIRMSSSASETEV